MHESDTRDTRSRPRMDLSGPAANAEQAFMLAVTPTNPRGKHKMSGRDSEIFAVLRKRKAEEWTTRCKR